MASEQVRSLTRSLGNHDITLDPTFYKEHGLHFHNQNPQESQACIDLIKSYSSITYLNHESTQIYLRRENGPRTHFKVFGSPYSPTNGLWAFGYPSEHASNLWDQIHSDTDIVITHTPPKYHCDESRHKEASGCNILRENLWRVRPSLAICGHLHEARGAERILWDLSSPNVKFKESATACWTDPSLGLGNRKQCYIDLSAKSPAPLNSNGSWIDASDKLKFDGPAVTSRNRPPAQTLTDSLLWTSAISTSGTPISVAVYEDNKSPVLENTFRAAQIHEDARRARDSENNTPEYRAPKSEASSDKNRFRDSREASPVAKDRGGVSLCAGLRSESQSVTRGQGGSALSKHCDLEALAGRNGRKETCVINASIMASSWPYKLKDNRKYNKPMIVDIDLPLW